MSIHEDLFVDSAMPLHFELHGDTDRVTYAESGGAATSIEAVVGEEKVMELHGDHGAYLECVRELTVDTSTTSVRKNGIVTVDGVSYSIRSVRSLGDSLSTVELVRRPASEVSRRDLRGPR